MRTRSLLIVVGIALATLTGCASAPLFVEDIRSTDAVDGRALVVLPVSGADDETGHRLGANMAWGLREAGYPAVYADIPVQEQPTVRGVIDETDFGESVVWLSLRWTVHAAAADSGDDNLGEIVGTHRHQVATTIEQWAVLSRQAINMIVAEAVPAVHEVSAALVFPDGMPVRTASDLLPDRQLASLADIGEGDTVVVSGDGLVIMPAQDTPLQTAQFEPVFEPAAIEPPRAPEVQPDSAPENAEPTIAKMPPGPPPLKPIVEPPAAARVIPKPAGQVINTDDDPGQNLPSVPLTPVTREAVESGAVTTADGGSPFSSIGDDTRVFEGVDVLTPASAALVTTDPWLTINEAVRVVEPTETPDEAQAREISSTEVSASASGVAAKDASASAVSPPPPPAPAVEPEAVDIPAFDQPVSETVVAETPAEPPIEPVATEEPPTEIAAGEVSADQLNASAAPNSGRPIFVVRQVTGAPGDGNAALTNAVREALRQISASVTDNPAQATHVLQGSVRVDSPFAGRQKVRIVWQVTGIDGQVTGQAVQENQVPQGSLEGNWGNTAAAVAQAAVRGVERLFPQPISSSGGQGLTQPDLPHVGND